MCSLKMFVMLRLIRLLLKFHQHMTVSSENFTMMLMLFAKWDMPWQRLKLMRMVHLHLLLLNPSMQQFLPMSNLNKHKLKFSRVQEAAKLMTLFPQVIKKLWQLQLLEVLRRRTSWTSMRSEGQAKMAESQKKMFWILWAERHNQEKKLAVLQNTNKMCKLVEWLFQNCHLLQAFKIMISKFLYNCMYF